MNIIKLILHKDKHSSALLPTTPPWQTMTEMVHYYYCLGNIRATKITDQSLTLDNNHNGWWLCWCTDDDITSMSSATFKMQ